ncbi:MAG: hypothetical protein HY393_04230 [Candidatus Diapherotrites archaeon]|nr:hypothetical protein [Candidatus Diapherotrites archaeon]
MEGKETWVAVAGILLAVGIAWAAFQWYNPLNAQPSLESGSVELQIPAHAFVGSPVQARMTASGERVMGMELSTKGFTQGIECKNMTTCTHTFEWAFSAPGVYEVIARGVFLNDSKTATQTIVVEDTTQRCADQTVYAFCSQKKPLYCDEGALVESCEKCGCPAGFECSASGACNPQPFALEISTLDAPVQVKTDEPFVISFMLVPARAIEPGTTFFWRTRINGAALEKEGSLEWSQAFNSTGFAQKVEFNGIGKEGAYDLTVQVFYAAPSEAQGLPFAEKTAQGPLTVVADHTPPGPLSNVHAVFQNGTILVSWAPSLEADVKQYKVYESTADEPGFTLYGFKVSVNAPSTSIELPSSLGGGVFVVSAVDWSGNESAYSAPAKAQ